MMFFDNGHDEYIRFYRRASKYLPTGSRFYEGWASGKSTKNMPLNMFLKDANQKISEMSYFIQIADLVCYAAFIKLKHERGQLREKRVKRGHHTLYDFVPLTTINMKATALRKDGIVPIGPK